MDVWQPASSDWTIAGGESCHVGSLSLEAARCTFAWLRYFARLLARDDLTQIPGLQVTLHPETTKDLFNVATTGKVNILAWQALLGVEPPEPVASLGVGRWGQPRDVENPS